MGETFVGEIAKMVDGANKLKDRRFGSWTEMKGGESRSHSGERVLTPPEVERIWGTWGSHYNMPKAIFYRLKGDYTLNPK